MEANSKSSKSTEAKWLRQITEAQAYGHVLNSISNKI